MRDRRFLAAVRRDKEAFAKKGRPQGCGEEDGRLLDLIREKIIVYRPGMLSVLGVQLRYMGVRAYGAPFGALLFVLLLTGHAQKKGVLALEEMFALASVCMIILTACFVGGLELAAENHMGELAAACYLNLGQIVCVRLVLGAAGELLALAAFHVVLGTGAAEGGAPTGVYLLLVWVLANVVYFFIFAAVRGRGKLAALSAAALLLSVLACFLSLATDVLLFLSGGVCLAVLLPGVLLLGGELAFVLEGIRKGEILCFD